MQKVLESWLSTRRANIIVGGEKLVDIMKNMIFQGTVLGPLLWNVFFRDIQYILTASNFLDVTFATDLNAMCCYPLRRYDDFIYGDLHSMPKKFHNWGQKNRVTFDAFKEVFHILSK